MKKAIALSFIILALIFGIYYFNNYKNNPDNNSSKLSDIVSNTDKIINNFIDCQNAGNLIMESYPRQCRSADGRLFVEDIGNLFEKNDLIRPSFPMPNQEISSPLEIRGEARGFWYFEASFPIDLINSQGEIIAQGIATAEDDWMSEDFVPFTARLDFTSQPMGSVGKLILKKDNPSGLPEYDDFLEIPIIFK